MANMPPIEQELPRADVEQNGRRQHVWSLPTDESYLEQLLRDLFEKHYDTITFGPIVPGAAYELKTPGKPDSVTMLDGYLTIHWGAKGHFHLCVGPSYGSPTKANPPEEIARRRPKRAEFYRSLDSEGFPTSWGFRMFNGDGEQQINILFPNPFIGPDDKIADAPDFTRLTVWRDIAHRYAGIPPSEFDSQGKGFRKS